MVIIDNGLEKDDSGRACENRSDRSSASQSTTKVKCCCPLTPKHCMMRKNAHDNMTQWDCMYVNFKKKMSLCFTGIMDLEAEKF